MAFSSGTFSRPPENKLIDRYLNEMVDDLYRRFETKFIAAENDCWNWTSQQDGKGYGRFMLLGKPRLAYRVAYELYCESIPDGMYLDHLCRNPKCVNPGHLEPVSLAENTRRGQSAQVTKDRHASQTHCKRGHPLSGDNLYAAPKQRVCRTCRAERKREYRAQLRLRTPDEREHRVNARNAEAIRRAARKGRVSRILAEARDGV